MMRVLGRVVREHLLGSVFPDPLGIVEVRPPLIQESVPEIETLAVRASGPVAQAPLADHGGGVSVFLEHLGDGQLVRAELLALAGGIGMVMVAPITAVIAGILYHRFYGLGVKTSEGR